MKNELGRSLIEIVGVIAIGAVMTAAAIGMFRTMRDNHVRNIASSQLKQIASDVKILMEPRGDYNGISVDYLIKTGALRSDKAPLGGDDWSVVSSADGLSFSISLTELTQGECAYFLTAMPTWASRVTINGYDVYNDMGTCFETPTNQVSFIVE